MTQRKAKTENETARAIQDTSNIYCISETYKQILHILYYYNFGCNNSPSPSIRSRFLLLLFPSGLGLLDPTLSSCTIPTAHPTAAPTSASSSARVLPACRHTLTRSVPFATVGQVIGRALSPCARRCPDRSRARSVKRGMIGVGGCARDGDGRWRR